LRKFCATGERGIDHEEVQSSKTAERLGLLIEEIQAFLFVLYRHLDLNDNHIVTFRSFRDGEFCDEEDL